MRKQLLSRVIESLSREYAVDPGVFTARENCFIPSDRHFFQGFTFGQCAVIFADPSMIPFCEERLSDKRPEDVFDLPLTTDIDLALREKGKKLGGACLRFLRAAPGGVSAPEGFDYRWVEKEAIASLLSEKERLSNAFNFNNDVIGFAAYQKGELAACAGADDAKNELWQIGIDTMNDFRGKGLASYLVSALADEIEARGKIPYYTTWQANIASLRVALRAGFEPRWLEYYAENL